MYEKVAWARLQLTKFFGLNKGKDASDSDSLSGEEKVKEVSEVKEVSALAAAGRRIAKVGHKHADHRDSTKHSSNHSKRGSQTS